MARQKQNDPPRDYEELGGSYKGTNVILLEHGLGECQVARGTFRLGVPQKHSEGLFSSDPLKPGFEHSPRFAVLRDGRNGDGNLCRCNTFFMFSPSFRRHSYVPKTSFVYILIVEDMTYKTINEICKEYGVVRATVTNWIKTGKLKAIRLHTQYRIPTSEWELFVKSSSNQE